MPATQDRLTLTLTASDADGDPLTYSARLQNQTGWAQAYALDQQLGLSYMGSYYTNFQGHNEKWLQGTDAQYFLLPNGELRRWRDVNYSYGSAGLVATLDSSVYTDPGLLWLEAVRVGLEAQADAAQRQPGTGGSCDVQREECDFE